MFMWRLVIFLCSLWTVQSTLPCPGCAQETQTTTHSSFNGVSREEVRRELLKWEKERILEQLGRPDDLEDGTRTTTPLPLVRRIRNARSITRDESDEMLKIINDTGTGSQEVEDVETALILGQKVTRGSTVTVQCYDETYGRMGTCIDFVNKTDIKWNRFKFATLRFRLDSDMANGNGKTVNHTFSVKAINYGKPESYAGLMPSIITATVTNTTHYIEVDVTQQILRRALALSQSSNPEERDSIHCIMTLRVTCLTCRNIARSPVSLDTSRLPFLEIGFSRRKKQKRTSPVCEMENEFLVKTPGKRGCCMVPVDVEFSEIGMDFILFPQRYRTHYCSGRCNMVTTRSYTVIIQNVIAMRLHKLGYEDQPVSLCCIPQHSVELPIIYMNESGAVASSNLREMLVTSCGC